MAEKKKKRRTSSPSKPKKSTYRYPITVDDHESERFQSAILHWNGLARARIERGEATIGILGEKSLHSILKCYITEDESLYEIPIRSHSEEGKRRRFVADICDGERIYEIQTGGFYPLIPKLRYYLEETDYHVTVVHPIPGVRYKVWIDPENGEIIERRKSTVKGSAETALKELFWIREFLPSERLQIKLLILEEEEYRYLDGWGKDKKRGSNRCERVPAALLGSVQLNGKEDYWPFLMSELPVTFTAADFGSLFGFRGKAVYSALKVFLSLGLFREIGKRGRSILYVRTDLEPTSEESDNLRTDTD